MYNSETLTMQNTRARTSNSWTMKTSPAKEHKWVRKRNAREREKGSKEENVQRACKKAGRICKGEGFGKGLLPVAEHGETETKGKYRRS